MAREPKKDTAHLAMVATVLAAVPDELPASRAALAFEDAYVTVTVGMGLGLPLARIKALATELLTADDEPTLKRLIEEGKTHGVRRHESSLGKLADWKARLALLAGKEPT